MEPKKSEATTKHEGSRVDVYDGPRDNHESHSVIHTAADGWTTHDYERLSDQTVVVDTPRFQGNVISGSEQYD